MKYMHTYVKAIPSCNCFQSIYCHRFFIIFFLFAVSGRSLLQFIPSVETVVPAAIAYGSIFGKRKGLAFGVSTFYMSNFFVWGLHGFWTPFQCVGAGIAGFMGGFLSKRSPKGNVFIVAVAATVIYEVIVNLYLVLLGMPFWIAIVTSLPFSVTHIVSTVSFCAFLPRTNKEVLGLLESH